MQQASSRVLENRAIASYRFRALKVPPGTPSEPGTSAARGRVARTDQQRIGAKGDV
jgi:hypothetical protein